MKLVFSGADYVQNEMIPSGCRLAGWAALVDAFVLRAPLRRFSCISTRHVRGTRRKDGLWEVFDKRFSLEDTLGDHLGFALRHEKIDLLLLKRLFDVVPKREIEAFVAATPTGAVARRVWFFYEFLTEQRLDLDDAPVVTAVEALDPEEYVTTKGMMSRRHRVLDNLLGTAAFCPVIRRTAQLDAFVNQGLSDKAMQTIGRTSKSLVSRASSFMLLADSRASFEIEGERPRPDRLQRWGKAVLEAGKRPLNQTEIYRLHRILVGDDRFTKIGYREEAVFLGDRGADYEPVPEFIGAKHEDVPALMTGLNQCNNRLRPTDIDPVLQAAIIAFGFVYIHPMADGNGRLHRCLVHHVLAERRFAPLGMVFPVSSVMLDRIEEYRGVLQSQTGLLMDYIDWRVLPNHNVEVINDTADLYRFFDFTDEAEFLYRCVARAVEYDLPKEILYLQANDAALATIMHHIEMPDRLAQDLIMHIRQNKGVLSNKRRLGVFKNLADDEVKLAENAIADAFEQYDAYLKGAPIV